MILYIFLLITVIFKNMKKKGENKKEIEFLVHNHLSLVQVYKDLNNAVNSNNTQTIWRLSKIIARHQLNL